MDRSFVCAYESKALGGSPVLLRTYQTGSAPVSCSIWEAARATSAAPAFFPPIKFGSQTGKVVQMLLDKGADVNAQGGDFGDALQAASCEGHEKVVQMLLDKGADVKAQGGRYGNALQAASYQGHEKVLRLLLNQDAVLSGKDI